MYGDAYQRHHVTRSATAPHSHERQEEVYVALDGGTVEIDGEMYEVAARGIVRIGPDPNRSLRNETDSAPQTWLLFGVPPHGTVEHVDEYRMPDE